MADISGGVGAVRSVLRASLPLTGKWAGGIAAIGGFVADVLNPLAPLAAWFAIAAAIVTVGVVAALAFKRLSPERGGPALIFSLAALAVSGGLWGLQKATAAENGLMAGIIPGVEQLQRSAGLIQESVERIETKVDVIGTQTSAIAAKTDEIAASIKSISDGFAALSKQGGLIANPKSPEEFYHNARIHELGGDMVNARASYLGFASFGVDALDPYLRFATLLRVQDGRAGAREVLGTLKGQKSSRGLELIHLLQFDDAPRLEKLNAFLAAQPDHGPAWKFLADEFSEDRLGQRSIADKKKEGEALAKFLSFEADGKLIPFFVDQTLLAEWLESARTRQKALGDLGGVAFAPALTILPAGEGWTVTVSLPEAATAIFWRLGEAGEFTRTQDGIVDFVDQRTGKKMPNPSFSLQKDAQAGKIYIKYTDLRDREAGPFSFDFNPGNALADSGKKMLEASWTSWLVFDASGFRGNLYFTQLVSFRCAVKQAAYSFNGAPLEKHLDLPACDPQKPYSIPDNFLPFFKVGEEVTSANLQLTYADGTKSPVRTFKRGQ
jgi:hypothetical protein